jgi:DNA-binding CsgD family transcriptional regulator
VQLIVAALPSHVPAIAAQLAAAGRPARAQVDRVANLMDYAAEPEHWLVATGLEWRDAERFVDGAQRMGLATLMIERAPSRPTHPALARGARAIVGPHTPPTRLRAALDAIGAGLTVVDPSRDARTTAGIRLSDREREVLAHVASGTPTKTIARTLGLAPSTVKYHVDAVFAKLGVTRRAEAVAEAIRRGELSL